MSAPEKFLFDTVLDAPTPPPPIAHEDVEQLKLDHADELERVKKLSFEQGLTEGRRESNETLERQLFQKIDQMIQSKEAMQNEINRELREARSSSLLLAMTIANKLAGTLLARHPLEHIEMFFNKSLSLLPQESDLRLHVAPNLAAALQPRLVSVMERNGQHNALVMVEDETIEGVNCRLVWNDGGIEQNTDEIYAHIEKLIETCLYSQAETKQIEPTDIIESAVK